MPTSVEASYRFLRYGRNDKVETATIIPPPCYSCAEVVGKRRDETECSNSAPAFAKQRRNTQLFGATFLVRFLFVQKMNIKTNRRGRKGTQRYAEVYCHAERNRSILPSVNYAPTCVGI